MDSLQRGPINGKDVASVTTNQTGEKISWTELIQKEVITRIKILENINSRSKYQQNLQLKLWYGRKAGISRKMIYWDEETLKMIFQKISLTSEKGSMELYEKFHLLGVAYSIHFDYNEYHMWIKGYSIKNIKVKLLTTIPNAKIFLYILPRI